MYKQSNGWQKYFYRRRCEGEQEKLERKTFRLFCTLKVFIIIVAVCLLVIGFSVYTIATTDFTKYEVEESQGSNQSLEGQTKPAEIPVPQITTEEVTKQDNLKKNASKSSTISSQEKNVAQNSGKLNVNEHSTKSSSNSKVVV